MTTHHTRRRGRQGAGMGDAKTASLTVQRVARVANGGDGTDLLTVTTAGGETISFQVVRAKGPYVVVRVMWPRDTVRVDRGEGRPKKKSREVPNG